MMVCALTTSAACQNNWWFVNGLDVASLVFVIISGVFAFVKWNEANITRRTELIQSILLRLRFDEELSKTIRMIDYRVDWYTADFHNNSDKGNDLEYQIDRLLSYISYICYLKNKKRISRKEFSVFEYEVNRICSSHNVQSYLWNIYHYSKECGTVCSFQHLIDYGVKNKLIDKKMFNNGNGNAYPKYLAW